MQNFALLPAASLLGCAVMSQESLSARELLRHSVATIAYRAGKIVRDAPQGYVNFDAGQKVRTPLQILAHISDLFDWALSMAKGKPAWHDAAPASWPDEVERFFNSLKSFDLVYRLNDSALDEEIARAKTGLLFFDYPKLAGA